MKDNCIKLNESTLRKIVAESIKNILKEDSVHFVKDDCDGYVVESTKDNQIVAFCRNKETALGMVNDDYNLTFYGFHFND